MNREDTALNRGKFKMTFGCFFGFHKTYDYPVKSIDVDGRTIRTGDELKICGVCGKAWYRRVEK